MFNPSSLNPPGVLQRALVAKVQGVFNDRARGEAPVVRSADGLYDPRSVIWRVHGDVTTMMIGGVTALLLQMLHPAALAGVWDHSSFRNDMLGRLRRTARFIAVTTFGERTQAEGAIARVLEVHRHVHGVLADGTPYTANDPELLAWVHVCEAFGFLDAWIRYGNPTMSIADQDAYFAQAALVARAFGADPVPENRAEAEVLILRFRPDLMASERANAVARMILTQPPQSAAAGPVQTMLMQAAVDILPAWAKSMHGLTISPVTRPFVRTGTLAVARTLRWAFDAHRQPVATVAHGPT
jgi:uncharacterized protein (DUF2236 family)